MITTAVQKNYIKHGLGDEVHSGRRRHRHYRRRVRVFLPNSRGYECNTGMV
jgi:hypothetical protein